MFTRIKYTRTILGRLVLVGLLVVLACGPICAFDAVWTGSVSFDYNVNGNWSTGLVPDGSFDDVAVIDNGDAVFLNSTAASDSAGLQIDTGSLEIRSGGTLAAVAGGFTPAQFPGNITIGGGGTLSVQRGGTLNFAGDLNQTGGILVLGEIGGAGTATLKPDVSATTGDARLESTTVVIGQNVDFEANSFVLGGGHVLQAGITGATHSPLSTSGNATLGGEVELIFSGPTPAVGDSWTLIDAGSVDGAFVGASTTAFLPLGTGVSVSTSAGGNGQLVSANIDNLLVLNINATTGAASMSNLSGTLTEDIDGYTITAASGLDRNGWTSFQDNSQPGWEESQNPSTNILGELNFSSSRVIGTSTTIPLGTPFVPLGQFGTTPEASFEYHLAGPNGGQTVQGQVNFTNHNNLVLQVDPTSGMAQIINPSGLDVDIDGYLIGSDSGSLDPNGWTSFQDDSQPGWEESQNPTPNNIMGELNFTGSRAIAKLEGDSPISLGAIFGGPETRDLEFEFHLAGNPLAGDFNDDGSVDGLDFLAWQQDPSLGSLSDWETNYGQSGGSPGGTFTGIVEYIELPGPLAAASVPEPASALLAVLNIIGFIGLRRRR